jgi:hypothetical protein
MNFKFTITGMLPHLACTFGLILSNDHGAGTILLRRDRLTPYASNKKDENTILAIPLYVWKAMTSFVYFEVRVLRPFHSCAKEGSP